MQRFPGPILRRSVSALFFFPVSGPRVSSVVVLLAHVAPAANECDAGQMAHFDLLLSLHRALPSANQVVLN